MPNLCGLPKISPVFNEAEVLPRKIPNFGKVNNLDVTKTGNRERGTGKRERGTGNGERGTGNGERGTGNGERGTGNGERGTGNGERESGNECTEVIAIRIQNGGRNDVNTDMKAVSTEMPADLVEDADYTPGTQCRPGTK